MIIFYFTLQHCLTISQSVSFFYSIDCFLHVQIKPAAGLFLFLLSCSHIFIKYCLSATNCDPRHLYKIHQYTPPSYHVSKVLFFTARKEFKYVAIACVTLRHTITSKWNCIITLDNGWKGKFKFSNRKKGIHPLIQ